MLDILARRLSSEFGVELSEPLLRTALTHSSWAFENGSAVDNERLEFLGDSVLGLAVSQYLFETYPECSEGQLSRLRSNIVSGKSLAAVAAQLNLGGFMLLGKGEIGSGGNKKSSLLANLVESLIGAVMVEQGFEKAKAFALGLLTDRIKAIGVQDWVAADPKTRLQELFASRGKQLEYQMSSVGPDHSKVFTATLELEGRTLSACGSSKKSAQMALAARVLEELDAGAA